MKDLSKEIEAYTLKNAIEFGKADAGKVLPKLFLHGLDRKEIKKVMPEIQKTVERVNSLPIAEQEKKFELLKGIVKEHEEKEKEGLNLPVAQGNVVTRMPPEPSKYLHVGHALSFLINYRYAKENKGKCILRFDDANPEKVSQEYQDAILDDIQNYLKIEPDKIHYVSDDIPTLYEHAEKLIDKKLAFMCFCDREKMQNLRHEGKECECRIKSPDKNKKEWKKLLDGASKEGEAVLRFKGDMNHKNHVLRDPVIMRVVKAKHFRTGSKYKVWPMYDFYSAVEDSILGVTHVVRTAEFDVRVELHEKIQKELDLPIPTSIQFGRINVVGADTKGRDIRERIASGEYSGWDDPRLVTLKALRRRGIRKEVLQELVNHIGLSKKQIHIDFAMIASISRKLLDKQTKRYYFVAHPIKLTIMKMPKIKEVEVKIHPDKDETRIIPIGKDVYIAENDYTAFIGKEVRLMNLCNLQLDKQPLFTGVENKAKLQKLQWVSEKAVPVKIMMDNGQWIEGLGEPALRDLKEDEVVQLERFGFVRLDKMAKTGLEFWFTHH